MINISDIIECKKDQRIPFESEEKTQYYRLFENMQEGFFIADIITDKAGEPVNYRFIEANKAFEAQIGIPLEKLIDRTAQEIYPDLDRFWIQTFGKVALTGKPVHFENQFSFQKRHYEVSAYQIRYGRFAGFFLDISDRKLKENELRASEEKYRSLYENSLDGILLTRPDGSILSANPQACVLFGMTEAELMKAGRESLVVKDEKLIAALQERELTGQAKAELTFRRKDGTTFIGETSSGLFMDIDGSLKTSMIIRDITERKQAEETLCQAYEEIQLQSEELQTFNEEFQVHAKELKTQSEELRQAYEALSENEEKYRKLFENMYEGFFIADIITDEAGEPVDYKFIEANKAFKNQLGIQPEKVIGRTAVEMNPGLDPFWIQTYGRVALTGKPAHFDHYEKIYGLHYGILTYRIKPGRFAALFMDITDQKKAEEKLRKSENEFRALAENSPDFIVRFDRQKRHIYVNPAGAQPYGFFPEEIIGKTFRDLGANPDKAKYWEERYEKVFVTGKPEKVEYEFRSNQGEKYYFDTKIIPEFVDGEVNSILIITRDIKDLKETEARLKDTLNNLENLVKERTAELQKAYNSLKESEERYRIVVEQTGHLVYDYDLKADKGTWAGAIEKITGYTPDEFQKFDRLPWIENVHPDDREQVVKKIREARKSGKPFQEEFRFRKKDGSYIYLEDNGIVLLDEKGNAYRSLGVNKDITERKLAQQRIQRSEKRYRSFVENLRGIAFQLDEDLNPEFIHGHVKEITGYTEEEVLLNRLWKQLIVPEDIDSFLERQEKAIQTCGDYQGEIDYRIRSKDGKIKWVHEIHQKILEENGRPLYTGIVYDITDKKEAEEALAKIEEARIKEIHHRIKNNLQVISSLLDLQAETFSDLETCKTADVIEAFVESQNRVISMALIHEELYKSKGMDSLDFSDYLQKLTRELFHSYNLRNEGIKLNMELEQAYLGMDTAIPLGIIVNELVSNSLKHAFPAGQTGQISIILKRADNFTSALEKKNINQAEETSDMESVCTEKNFHYLLKVADTGKGIPEEIDFQNADSLGFQLVNILVEQIDGCVELEKEKRTEFTIWFKNIDKYVDK